LGQPAPPLVTWLYPFDEKPANKAAATDYFMHCCALEIQQLLQQDQLKIDGEPVQARDLAVLVKTSRQASLIKQQLAKCGVGSALILRDSVFETTQAWEINLLLQVLIEPGDIRHLLGLLSTDLFGWNSTQIRQLQQDDQQLVSILEQIKDYQVHWQNKGILSMFFKLLEQQRTLQRNSGHMDGERRMTNWLHIMELLQQHAGEHASLSQALNWLRLQRESVQMAADNEEHQLRLESDSDLVRIVTVHKSKGLEYPIVFLPFMWNVRKRDKPNSYSVHDEQGNKTLYLYNEDKIDRWYDEILAEEIRLFYVAVTRAKYRCYLGWGHIRGAGSSAIAQCLYPNQIKPGRYPRDLALENLQQLQQAFSDLNAEQPMVELLQPDFQPSQEMAPVPAEMPVLQALEFDRHITRGWRISSYSQMASSSSQSVDRPDYDAMAGQEVSQETDFQQPSLTRFNFPKGTKPGTFLHDILEHTDFSSSVDELLLEQKCHEYGYAENWVEMLGYWLNDILHCDLGGFSLSSISQRAKITEMEFYLSCRKIQAPALNLLLRSEGYLEAQYEYAFSEISGYLKGFIDLVFEHNGKFYIADYKSNFLGDSMQCYDIAACEQAMAEHDYHLQYLIYSLALHRYLQQRLQQYDYEKDFGGVYYLFLRGMNSEQPEVDDGPSPFGVYFHRPRLSTIRKLEGVFE
jgi:exodeoxyribonuclease V beta subunit